jgi:hypothetical protein
MKNDIYKKAKKREDEKYQARTQKMAGGISLLFISPSLPLSLPPSLPPSLPLFFHSLFLCDPSSAFSVLHLSAKSTTWWW